MDQADVFPLRSLRSRLSDGELLCLSPRMWIKDPDPTPLLLSRKNDSCANNCNAAVEL